MTIAIDRDRYRCTQRQTVLLDRTTVLIRYKACDEQAVRHTEMTPLILREQYWVPRLSGLCPG
jgi:hypothetical protein